MKKNRIALKFFSALAILLVVIGGVTFVLAFGKLNFDYRKLDTTTYVQKAYAYESETPLNHVKIHVDYSVKIVSGDAFSIAYHDDEKATEITTEAGVVSVLHAYNFKLDFHMFKFRPEAVVTIPSGISLEVETINAKVVLDSATMKAVTIEAVNLDFSAKNTTFTTCEFDSTNVNITALDSSFTSLNNTSTNSDVSLTNVKLDKLTEESINIELTADNLTFDVMEINTVNADFLMSITGKKSDYHILVDKVNGNVFRPQTGTEGDKRIDIDVVNMSGTVRFLGDVEA